MKLVYTALQDLFFSAKIIATARHTGASVVSAESYNELIEKINDQRPDLVIVDLNGFMTPAHVSQIKSKGIRVIGYLSHIQTELKERFNGTCEIMSQSEFSQKLPQILG